MKSMAPVIDDEGREAVARRSACAACPRSTDRADPYGSTRGQRASLPSKRVAAAVSNAQVTDLRSSAVA